MTQFVLVNTETGNGSDPIPTRSEAQDRRGEMSSYVDDPDVLEIHTIGERKGDECAEKAEVVETGETAETQAPEPVPEGRPDIDEDPADFMPSHFVDEIDNVPTLNKKGYAVMAERFNVSVTSEPVVRSSENDFEFAEFRATAVTESGEEYSGFGSAHVERGDDPYLLNEHAETRAMKRAGMWAMGLGMTAKEEMEGSL